MLSVVRFGCDDTGQLLQSATDERCAGIALLSKNMQRAKGSTQVALWQFVEHRTHEMIQPRGQTVRECVNDRELLSRRARNPPDQAPQLFTST